MGPWLRLLANSHAGANRNAGTYAYADACADTGTYTYACAVGLPFAEPVPISDAS